ncbi:MULTISPECIES: MEDS domain-containing protein [Bacillaceae]|uniref:MEDS domain-containing protein n=1 Tax=Bacillaceae TaxID=186817 RepID=UPI000AF3827F|nr:MULTISPECIES: MEDS domain-containing protein [Bacillaceae]
MKSKINQLFEDQKSVHVVYTYKGMDTYIEQAVSYIKDGVIAGDYVIFVENERLYSIIQPAVIILPRSLIALIKRYNHT